MTMISRLLGVALFSAFLSMTAGGGEARANSATEIKLFEDGFSTALAHNDAGALKRYLSEGWKIVSGDGQVITRARFLDVIASGDLKHDTMSSQDQTIELYGDTALVTGRAQSGGRYKGVEFHTDEIGTDVLVKVHDRWVCVFTQLTTVTRR
jgi:ketosteroid isomerase-like protein